MLSIYDIDLIRRDPALPGLPILLDTEAFVAALQPFAPGVVSGRAKATYVRYKPGMNCLVAYELAVGSESLMVYAKAHRRQDLEKIEKAGVKASTETALGPGRFVMEDTAIVVSFFPNDSKMSVLGRLADESTRKHLLERVFPHRPELCTGTIEPLRYKPERRYVARLCVDDRAMAALKFFPGPAFKRALDKTRAFKSQGPLKLASRLGRSRRHGILALEWLPGRLLSHTLLHDIPDDDEVTTVGAALAALHAQQTNRLPLLFPDKQAASLQAVAEGLSLIWPALEDKAQSLAVRLGRELVREAGQNCPIHGDFYANQVLLSGNTAAIIDLDESVLGNPATDLGNFMAHLERDGLCGRLSADRIHQIKMALIKGYDTAAPSLSPGQIDLYTAAGLLHLAPHPFRYRESNWPVRIRSILDRAEAFLRRASGPRPFFTQSRRNSIPAHTESPDANATVRVDAPADEMMPYLPLALQADEAWPQCRPLFQALTGTANDLSLHEIRLIRYKPGRRCLIEYSVEYQNAGEELHSCSILGKSRAKGLDRSTYQLMHTLWDGAFNERAEDGIFVPQPLGVAPAFNMWLQRKVDGRVATSLLNQPEGRRISRDIAHALRKLQESGPPAPCTHTIADELAILERRLPLVLELYPAWDERIFLLLKGCRDLADRLPETSPRPVHRDFYPENILIAEQGVCLLDFDLYSLGDPALDAGNFIGHLIEYGLRVHGDPGYLHSCEQVFEDTFVALSGESIRPAIHIYTTLTLARHVHISTLFPERRDATEALLTLCERRLHADRQVARSPHSQAPQSSC